MKISDAAKILGLSGEVTSQEIKAAYRNAAMTYHPAGTPPGPR